MIDHGTMEIIETEEIDGAIYVICVCRTCGKMVRFGLGEFRVIEPGDLEARHRDRNNEPVLGDVWGEFLAGLDLSGLGDKNDT